MRREGRAIKIRIIAGRIVQTISTSWASIVFVCVSFVVIINEMTYNTKALIKKTIIMAWS